MRLTEKRLVITIEPPRRKQTMNSELSPRFDAAMDAAHKLEHAGTKIFVHQKKASGTLARLNQALREAEGAVTYF